MDGWMPPAGKGAACDLSGNYFVLLGAGAAMGPLITLLSLGANIIAIDIVRACVRACGQTLGERERVRKGRAKEVAEEN